MATTNLFNCRFCLCETVEPRNMVQDADFSQRILEVFPGLNINVSPDNGLSVLVCEYCYNFITQFHAFYVTVRDNQDFLVYEQNSVKMEPEIEVDYEDPVCDSPVIMKTESVSFEKKEETKKSVPESKRAQSERGSVYMCDYCDKCFTTKAYVAGHVLRCSDKQRKLIAKPIRPSYRKVPKPHELTISCNYCPTNALKFKNNEVLQLHLTEHDRFERIDASRSERGLSSLMQCPKCERRFGNDDEFVAHLRNHKEGRFMTCELCGRSIVTSSLKTHLKLHFKRFCCEFCSHKFRNRCDLMKHIRLNHSRPDSYECHFCMKKIKYKSSLEKHLEFCRGPGTVGPCVHCGETFVSRSDRMYHVQKYHTGYVCRTCNVQVEGVTALKNHRKSEEHKQRSLKARIQREELKQKKLLMKKAPLRKVTFGLNLM